MSNQNELIEGTIGKMFSGMESFLSTKTVVGEPIYLQEDTIILPLVDVSFGMGAGNFAGEKNNGVSGGMGGKMKPSAVIVLHNGSTRLINIATHNGIEKLLDMVPDFVDKFKNRGKKQSEEEKAARAEAAEEMVETITDAANV